MVKTDLIFSRFSFFSTNVCELAHFSTTIGAVHNSNYTLFEIGAYANRGLTDLALSGETHVLEQELANEVSILTTKLK